MGILKWRKYILEAEAKESEYHLRTNTIRKSTIIKCSIFICLIVVLAAWIPINIMAAEGNNIDEYGDREEISILKRGIKIVNEDGVEIVVIDKFGGIYLNGDVYVNHELYNNNENNMAPNHNSLNLIVIYIMLGLLFILYFIMFCRNKIIGGHHHE